MLQGTFAPLSRRLTAVKLPSQQTRVRLISLGMRILAVTPVRGKPTTERRLLALLALAEGEQRGLHFARGRAAWLRRWLQPEDPTRRRELGKLTFQLSQVVDRAIEEIGGK